MSQLTLIDVPRRPSRQIKDGTLYQAEKITKAAWASYRRGEVNYQVVADCLREENLIREAIKHGRRSY